MLPELHFVAVVLVVKARELSFSVFPRLLLPRKGFGVVKDIRTQILIQAADCLHVLVGERESHDAQILGKVVGLGTGDGNQAALYNPSEHYLRA